MALEVKQLEVTQGALANEGYHPIGFGIEYWKEHQASFSDAHHVLMDFLWLPGKFDYCNSLKMINDPDGTQHPEVYQAWRAAGGDENIQMVAKVPELGKWGVGFGGKKNAERAAKLALAVSIAMESEETAKVIRSYPGFGQLLSQLGYGGGGMGMMGGGMMGMGGMMGGMMRASPY